MNSNYFLTILSVLSAIYIFQIVRFYVGLFRLKPGVNSFRYSISIIIPARNEEHYIYDCLFSLLAQQYPPNLVEIIVVDDGSTDNTPSIVFNISQSFPRVKLFPIDRDDSIISHKKFAISEGIKLSSNELIFTTDADCIAPPLWIETMISHFEENVGIVSGVVIFNRENEKNLFHKIQSLEFLSLVIAGAGSIAADLPIIANGANLAYRRSVFEQVEGFKGIDNLKSGDDDLFIQKVSRLTAWKIKSAAELSAIMQTNPVPNVAAFLNQRARWASKSMHYHNPLFVFYLISVYLFYVMLFFTVPLSLLQKSLFSFPLIAFLLKFLFDFLLLQKGTKIVGRRDLLKYILFAELFQIPYILWVGLNGLFGKFSWKDR